MSSAVASSVDGRRFTFESPNEELELRPGGYAVCGGYLGQVHEVEPGERGFARGGGILLDPEVKPFGEVPIEAAAQERVASWLETARPARAALDVGELVLQPRAAVRARRERVRPAHVPLRPVGLGKDVRAGHGARAAAARDLAADRRARPELGLRPAGRAARRGRRRAGRALPRGDRRPRGASAAPTGSDRLHVRFGDRDPRSRRRCCGSTRSPTATSTPRCSTLLDSERPGVPRGGEPLDGAARVRRAPGSTLGSALATSASTAGRSGRRADSRLARGARAARRPALPRRGPRLARDAARSRRSRPRRCSRRSGGGARRASRC